MVRPDVHPVRDAGVVVSVAFEVVGRPVAQGSMRAAVHGVTGKLAVFHDRAPMLSVWRHWCTTAAVGAMAGNPPLLGPVRVELYFTLTRPAAHRKLGVVRDRFAAARPDRAPDLDKLARAALDAMSGVVYWDDGQVCELEAVKRYGEGPGGLVVNIETL